MLKKTIAAAAFCIAAGSLVPSMAQADVKWVVTATFDDGGKLNGYFDIDQYGFLDGYDLTTSGGSMPGVGYTPSNSYFQNGAFYVDAQPLYQGDLHIVFQDDLGVPVANNPILGGSPGPSYECQGSFSCYDLQGGTTRFIATGSAIGSVPEPAIWTVMLIGFLGIGVTARMARRFPATAAV